MTKGRKPAIVPVENAITTTPDAPVWLSAAAKAEWRRVAPLLIARRILTAADLGTLESYCVAVGTVQEAASIIAAEGLTVTSDAGPKRHPASVIQDGAMKTARQIAAELGLTPASRAKAAVREEATPVSADLGLD